MTGSPGALTNNQAATTKKWEIEPRIWSQLCGLSFCRCLAFYLPVSPLTTTAWIVENKLNVTLFAGNSIVFSPCFWWRHQEWHGAHRRSRSRFLCVMLHLHIQWSATREQRSSSMIGGDLYRVSNIFNFSTSEVLDLWPDHPRVCEAWLWYRPGRLDFPIISDSGVYICIMYNYIYIYLFTSVRNSGRLWYITYITYKTCITYWLVSPCKVRPCGLLCPRALFCEWWPWTPFLGTSPWRPWPRRRRFGVGVLLALRPKCWAGGFIHFVCSIFPKLIATKWRDMGFGPGPLVWYFIGSSVVILAAWDDP